MEKLSECKICSGRKRQPHVPGEISVRNAGENELWPLVMNPYHLNESTFRGIRRSFLYLFHFSMHFL